MNYAALLRSALVALLRNKMRSILTVLGITIGIAAVICVVAIGKAGQARVEQQLNNLGDNFVWIEAGGRAVNGVRTGTHGTKSLVLADAIAIKNQIPLIKSVSPNVDASVQIIYGNQNWFTSYRGVSPEYFDIKRWYIDQGAAFSQDDTDRAADVCVIGRTVRDQLFGVEDPVGRVIRVKDLPCKVVGTLLPKGLSVSGQDQDDTIILPYTTAQKKIKGITWLDDVLCSAVSQDAVKIAGQEAAALLRDRHHLRPEEEDDFNIRNPEDIIQAYERHARFGNGEDAGDWGTSGRGRYGRSDSTAIPRGIGNAQPGRRRGGCPFWDCWLLLGWPDVAVADAAVL